LRKGVYVKQSFIKVAIAAMAMAAMPAVAQTITHDDPDGFRTSRGSGDAPVGRLTVNTAQSITSFGVDVDLNGTSNMQFLIFNSATGALLFQSAIQSFADTGPGFKFANPFSFTFNPGITYGLTAASSAGGLYLVDFTANSVSGFNFLTGNQNLGGTFGNSTLNINTNCCDVSTALVLGTAAIPEPASWAMMMLGFGLVGGALRRRNAQGAINAPVA
jgi:hypothetical protein